MRTQKFYKSHTSGPWLEQETCSGGTIATTVMPSLRCRGDNVFVPRLARDDGDSRPLSTGTPSIHLTDGHVKVDIVLLPDFDMYNLSAIIDVLAAANRLDQRARYAHRVISLSGPLTSSSCGFAVQGNGVLEDVVGKANIFIVGSCTPTIQHSARLCNWVRFQSRRGSNLLGIGSGAGILAASGLTDFHKVAASSRARQIWREIYPDTDFVDSIFATDETLTTTPGGRAAVHLAMAIVTQVSGPDIALKVADVLNLASVRRAAEPQRFSANGATGGKNDLLSRALGEMFANMEQPISSEDLSRQLQISTRQLQRIFKSRLKMNPSSYYVARRLDYARDLIQQTQMSVTEAAVAAGFVSLSHFSKRYRQRFGVHPRYDR